MSDLSKLINNLQSEFDKYKSTFLNYDDEYFAKEFVKRQYTELNKILDLYYKFYYEDIKRYNDDYFNKRLRFILLSTSYEIIINLILFKKCNNYISIYKEKNFNFPFSKSLKTFKTYILGKDDKLNNEKKIIYKFLYIYKNQRNFYVHSIFSKFDDFNLPYLELLILVFLINYYKLNINKELINKFKDELKQLKFICEIEDNILYDKL
jgi:hypothetical protein